MADSNTNNSPAGFEEVAHTADRALRLWAPDFKSLLIQAALGMARIMTGEAAWDPLTVQHPLALDALDREGLLVAWLEELVYCAEARREVFFRFDFQRLTDRRLAATAHGIQVQELRTEIKAVTYHGLEIVETAGGLEATVVLDV